MADARSVHAVFFDVGGTLARPRLPIAEVLVRSARAAGVPISPPAGAMVASRLETLLAIRAQHGEAFTYPPERSRRRWVGIYRASLEGVCSSDDADRIAEDVFGQLSSPAGYELFSDALPTLRTLSDGGLALGVVSNWEAWLPDLLRDLGISDFFACALASGEVQIEKPDPAIFAAALSRAGWEPDEALYVGDSVIEDMEGAAGAGMRGVLLDRSRVNIGFTAAPVINALTELPPLMARLQPVRRQLSGAASTSARLGAGGRSTR